MSERSLVRNAADRQQVQRAARKEQDLERLLSDNMRAVMSTPEGRFTMWALLERLGVYRSIWENSSRIHYNAGRQDAGHELMALIIKADAGRYEQMEREARERAKRLDREIDAAHTPRATEGGE